MKNFTKLFLAVAAALFAYACVTDTTNDLGVKLDGQVTEITISLEESRTQLGDKAGDFYPLYWSEGDAISVNGIASAALSAAQAGSAAATFVVEGAFATPYCIAYPAAPAGQVLFAENQNHVSNTTFGSGVSTMYAYGDSNGVQLSHLTGVLKIGVVGSATITKAQISTIDRAPIAGAFNFDFEKGVATATADSKHVINYSFGEGVQLSSEATYLHVAVPAGVYDELYVTLFDADGGAMYATVKADDTKPLAVGKVRNFTNTINYEPSSATIIKNKAELLAWAANSASTTDVVLAADIDMTGEAWTSVTEFAGVFRGNGYAIKGLTAPLFGDVNAKAITGVHLVDVDINATNNPNVGALAGWLKNADAVVSNCSASGKITLNYDGSITDTAFVSGLISRLDSATEVKNLVSNVAIEVTGKYAACDIGGVVAYAPSNPLTNCTNLGTITFSGETTGILYIGGISRICNTTTNCVNGSKDDKTGETGKIVINGTSHGAAVVVSGLIEQTKSGGTAEARAINANNHNYGNIYYSTPSAKAYVQLCGILRQSNDHINWNHCSNHGDIIVSGGSDVAIYVGGFEARHFNATIYNNSHNYGDITITSDVNTPELALGGLVGTLDDTGEAITIQSCTNHGNIKVYSSIPKNIYLGGFLGRLYCGQFLVGEDGNTEMLSHNYGDILYEANNTNTSVYAGGDIGVISHNLSGNETHTTLACRLANFTNHGDITINGSCKTAQIGGLFGRVQTGSASKAEGSKWYNTLYDSCNKGNMTINATVDGGDCAIGGLYGFLTNKFTGSGGNWVNEGKLVFTGETVTHRLILGGYVGATDKPFLGGANTIYNFGDIECTGKINTSKNNRVGGLFGQTNSSFNNVHVFCNIKTAGYSNVGMLTGCTRAGNVVSTNCSAGGTICFESEDNYNADGDLVGTKDKVIALTAENFFEYLYGTKVDWTGIENYDGCTFLSEKPTL